MKKIINSKYIIYTEVWNHGDLIIVENTETNHWVIGDLLSIGIVFRSSTSYESINLGYESNFNPFDASLCFDATHGQFYIKTSQGDQYIQNEKYIEMMKEFNLSKREEK